MVKNLPFWGQLLFVVVLSAAFVFVAYYYFPGLADTQREIEDLKSQDQGKQDKIREGHAIEAQLPEFERRIASLKQKLEDLKQILPTVPETGDLLKWIKNLADQSNLDLKFFSPEAFRPVEFYKEFPIRMSVTGGYHDLGLFFDRVGKYARIINVTGVNIDQNPAGDPSIKADFTATTFIYDEEAEAAAAAVAAPPKKK
jgi:type IV pilus assembly protein PilO